MIPPKVKVVNDDKNNFLLIGNINAFQADSVYALGIFEVFKVGAPPKVSCSNEVL